MQKKQAGFSLVLLLIALVIVGGIGYAGWYIEHRNDAPQTATDLPMHIDPTANWKSYTNTEGKYQLKYPAGWVTAHPDDCNSTLILLGPTNSTVGTCSQGAGEIVFYTVNEDETGGSQVSKNASNIETSPVTLNGVRGKRVSSTISVVEAAQIGIGGNMPVGTKVISYVFYAGGKTYIGTYLGKPAYPDRQSDFELMVHNTWKFPAK
jgi:hypothetical protein